VWLATAIILYAFAGCSRPDRRMQNIAASAGPPATGDWIVVHFDAEPESLNPMLSTTAAADRVEYGINDSHIFETLLQYDPTDWSFTKPLLAESYPEISNDHLNYTFTVRDSVQWHDGRPFTDDDVLFSVKVIMCPLVDAARKRGEMANLVDVSKPGPRKIRFTFSKPNFLNAVSLGSSTLSIIPKHVFDPAGLLDSVSFKDIVGPRGTTDPNVKRFADEFNKHPASRAPVGTGPYRFEGWETGKELSLVRNKDYWGQQPYIDRIVYRIIQDRPAALTALKAGDVDLVPRLLPVQHAQQTGGAQFKSQFTKAPYPTTQYAYIAWNEERPFFKDKRVRQALTMLIDRKQIIETLRFGLGELSESHFNPNSPDYNTNLKPYPYDPARAAQLLDEAGWKDTDGDGVRDKDGVPFRFEFLGTANSVFISQLLPILKEEFRKAGIDMRERMIEFTVVVNSMRDHHFDASSLIWVTPLVGDPYEVWHTKSIANRGSNYAGFSNAEADRLLDEARVEFDPERRRKLYWRWQEIIYDEQPYVFLYVPEDVAAYQKRFQNAKWYPPDPAYDLHEWFVPTISQRYSQSPLN